MPTPATNVAGLPDPDGEPLIPCEDPDYRKIEHDMLKPGYMRFAVIGCGSIAQVMHIPYLAEIPDAELHAFVDPAEGRVDVLADRYNVPNVYASHEPLLEDIGDELDAVVVLTPSHADIVVDILDAGIDTLVEKPLAASLEDADRWSRRPTRPRWLRT